MCDMSCFDIDINEKNINELYNCIKSGKLYLFKKTEWLLDMLNEILDYEQLYGCRPAYIVESLYDKFKDLFSFNDITYRGLICLDKLDLKDIIGTGELVSWSKDFDIAYNFGMAYTKVKYETQVLIVQYQSDGFDFHEFLKYIYNNIKSEEFNFIESYLNEKEVLAYCNTKSVVVYDLTQIEHDELKEMLCG